MAQRPDWAENGRSHQKAGHCLVQDKRVNEHFPLWVTTVRQPRKKYMKKYIQYARRCSNRLDHVQVFCGLIKRGRAGGQLKVKCDVSLKVELLLAMRAVSGNSDQVDEGEGVSTSSCTRLASGCEGMCANC